MYTHQFSWGLRWAGLSQSVDISANGNLSPDAGLGLFHEASFRVHYKHPIGRQPIHVTIGVLPLCCFFLVQ